MKHIIIISLLTFFSGMCKSQTPPANSSNQAVAIKEQAQMMSQLLVKKDFKSFVKYTYPKILEMMGGEEKMVEVMKEGIAQMESQGTFFLSITIGEPSKIITSGNELQCTVPQTIELKVNDGRLVSKSTLIGISTDNGKNWYFVDASGKDFQMMQKGLPNLSGDLVIPAAEQPTFYKE